MDTQDMSPLPPSSSDDHTSRPSLGFPLGAALLLIVILTLCAIFSCCYHWDKFRSLRRNLAAAASPDLQNSPPKPTTTSTSTTRDQGESLPVVMPGDNVPKFIALSCPYEPHRLEGVVVVEAQQKQPKSPRSPLPL